jgi:serine/threonine protein kinase
MAPSPSEAECLVEELAAEMARRWERGERPRAEEYLSLHPLLGDQPESALELVYEEIHLRQESGEEVAAEELFGRFPRWRRQVETLLECHHLLAPRLAGPRFPAAGETLGEFRLLAELGRGAQGRVFLAAQPSLADRPVVLKLGPRTGREHLSLARLQHTHIVPLYSCHDFPARRLRGLCLPYFGGATLARILEALSDRPPQERTGQDLLEALRRAQAASPATIPVGGPACRFLAATSFVQAVCWVGACLADALHYAHERGLLHLDLKPSNVLLAADGQPMLLDFHLARGPVAAGRPAPIWLGGTPGCMAPEHQAALEAVSGRGPVPTTVDGRADVYALGRLLWEMLAGRPPNPTGTATRSLRRLNPQVTPGLAALLARCTAPPPQDRYPTAAALAADLRRQLADQPLRGVANRSLAERWGKWRRRRPHALPLAVLLMAGIAAAAAGLDHVCRQGQRARAALCEGEACLEKQQYAEALERWKHGLALADDLPFGGDLTRRLRDRLQVAEQGQAAQELHLFAERVRPLYCADPLPQALARAVETHCRTFWHQRDAIARSLGPQAAPGWTGQVRADLLDLAILWVHLRVRLAMPNELAAARKEALEVLGQAEALFGPSCVLSRERQANAGALGLTDIAEKAFRQSTQQTPSSAWEHCALGLVDFRAGDFRRAAEQMDRALELEPDGLWPNFYRGSCAYHLQQYEDAAAAFSVCVGLAPRSAWCWHNRALAYAALGRLDKARHDCHRASRLDPTLAPARTLLSQLGQER